jgi:hypothetical protein
MLLSFPLHECQGNAANQEVRGGDQYLLGDSVTEVK